MPELFAITDIALPADFAAVAPAIAADAGGAAAVSAAPTAVTTRLPARCVRAAEALQHFRANLRPRARQPLLHRILGDAEEVGDVFRGTGFAVVEDDHFARLLRPIGDHLREHAPLFIAQQRIGRSGTRVDRGGERILITAFTSVIAKPEIGLIPCQLPQPWQKTSGIPQLAETRPDGQKDFLRDVLTGLHVSNDRKRDAAKDVRRLLDDARVRIAIAGHCQADIRFVHRVHSLPPTVILSRRRRWSAKRGTP
jgi:hypothetical protein